jgi:hypothetical protein
VAVSWANAERNQNLTVMAQAYEERLEAFAELREPSVLTAWNLARIQILRPALAPGIWRRPDRNRPGNWRVAALRYASITPELRGNVQAYPLADLGWTSYRTRVGGWPRRSPRGPLTRTPGTSSSCRPRPVTLPPPTMPGEPGGGSFYVRIQRLDVHIETRMPNVLPSNPSSERPVAARDASGGAARVIARALAPMISESWLVPPPYWPTWRPRTSACQADSLQHNGSRLPTPPPSPR